MKMRIIIMTFAVVFSGLLWSGCSDFLEEDPSAKGTAETYFPTPEGFDGALNACYASLRAIHNNRHFWLYGTDQFTGTNGYPTAQSPGSYDNINTYSPASLNADNGDLKNLWERTYIGIDRCNRVIQLSETAEIDAAERAIKVAEALTLRALYYYYLVEQFGAIPFPLVPYTTIQTTAERIPEETIYAQLINDLEDVQGTLPLSSTQFGRVTKGTAQTLLSKLYLTRGYKSFAVGTDFANAAKYADAVINSGAYSLLPDYRMIFVPNNEKNEEIIFSIQWTKDKVLNAWDWSTGTNNYGNNAHSKFGIAYDNFLGGQRSSYYNRGLRTYNETFHILECFGVDTVSNPGKSYEVPGLLEPLNIHPENMSYTIDKRYNATFMRLCMTEVSRVAGKQYGPDKTTQWTVRAEVDWAVDKTNNLSYNPANTDINKNYWVGTGRDTSLYIPRPDESKYWPAERFMKLPYAVLPKKLWFEDNNGATKKMFTDAYGDIGSVWFHVDWLQVRPFMFKFWEPESGYADNWGIRDLFLMRLGEVYLIAAEAYLKAGNTTEAANRINTIRRRATGGDINAPSIMDITAADVDIDFILDERTRELVGEEHRWVELKRTSKLIERTLKYNYWTNSPYIPAGKPYLDNHSLLRPLPYSWWSLLTNKDEVSQNPGY